jgi:predicted Zn-dependent peptidase
MLDLINTALGGSFTSRLNQNLREEHGWSYGARSAFNDARGTGSFVARASVVTEATGPALKEMLRELDGMATGGLNDEELVKVKAQDRAELVQAYEGVGGMAQRAGALAMLGLSPDFDARASRARQLASREGLLQMAGMVSAKNATIVVVGPREAVGPQLAALELGEPELWDAEGFPLKAGAGESAKGGKAAAGKPAASAKPAGKKK